MGRAGRRMDAQHGRGATVGRVGDALDKLFFRFHAVDAGGQHFVEPRESERFPKGDGLLARACLHGLSSLLARGPKAAAGNRPPAVVPTSTPARLLQASEPTAQPAAQPASSTCTFRRSRHYSETYGRE